MNLQEWLTVWLNIDRVVLGFGVTVLFFTIATIAAFIGGCVLAYLMEGQPNFFKSSLRTTLDLLRTLPFLIVLYILYYGLPQIGIRMSAWMAGMIALSVYHASYYAEILRGARAMLSQGQIESAKAYGFTSFPMYYRILLPQMVLRSGPLFGNQLVGCIKDTAFLSIITIFELTAAANDLQAVYFIPMPAFIVVIALYWCISLLVEKALRLMGRYAKHRGLSYE
jgi:polar amino acid transport system permease protein